MSTTFASSEILHHLSEDPSASAMDRYELPGLESPPVWTAPPGARLSEAAHGGDSARPVPRPEQLSACLAHLQDKPEEAVTQALWKLVHRLNRSPMGGAAQRLELLEILRPVLVPLLGRAPSRESGERGFPLATGVYLSAMCRIRLASALGQGYWLVINDPEFARQESILGNAGDLIIRRALEIHGLAMLLAAENYAPLPAGYWRRVYGMYARAEIRAWVDQDCGAREAGEFHATIAGVFKHLCLFAVANSHQYRPDEIREAFRFVGRYATDAELLSAVPEGPHRTPFLIDLFADAAPAAYELRATAAPLHSGVRYLRTPPLLAESLGGLGDGVSSEFRPLRRARLRSLVKTLGKPLARRSRRFHADSSVGLVLGLGYIQNALTEVDEREYVEYRGVKWLRIPDFALEEVESIELVDRTGFTDPGRPSAPASDFPARYSSGISREAIWARDGVAESVGVSAMMVDSSSTGYGLRIGNQSSASLKVGSLVGLRNQAGALHVGVVRWLRYDEAGNLGFGVELLMPATVPARVVVPGENRRSPAPALFYPGNSPLARDARLLAVPGALKLNQVAVLESLSGQPAFRVERLLESSPEFQQFAVRMLS